MKIVLKLILFVSPLIFAQNIDVEQYPELKELFVLSRLAGDTGNFAESIRINTEALTKAKAVNSKKYILSGYRALGRDYLELNDTVTAIKFIKKAQDYSIGINDEKAIAHTYLDLATMTPLSKINVAATYFEEAIKIFKKMNYTRGVIGSNYNAARKSLNAEAYDVAFKYLNALKALHTETPLDMRVAIQNYWGEYYSAKKDFIKADKYFKNAVTSKDSKKSGTSVSEAYKNYSENLFRLKQYKKAFIFRKKYDSILDIKYDNLLTSELEKASTSAQVREYKESALKNEHKSQLQAVELKHQNAWNNTLIITTLILILCATLILVLYKKRLTIIKKLRERNIEYYKAKEKSEHLAKATSNFFATVSHELRTPLYGVIGISSLLLENPKVEPFKDDLKSLKFSADYLLTLINDVLQISKLEADRLEEKKQVFCIRELTKTITTSLNYLITQNNNTIQIEIDDDIPDSLIGYKTGLSQVLINLLGNANKFTQGGNVSLKLTTKNITEDEISILFLISDTGIGIPQSKLESIFDEFTQIKHDNAAIGTGLGLPIVKRILKQFGSEIHVESVEEQGSHFYFELKLETSNEITTAKPEKIELNYNVDSLKDREILIVDDNKINQLVTEKILNKYMANCTISSSGQEAIDAVKSKVFDLILMDLNMPGIDGYEATKKIRSFNSTIPIIALTAMANDDTRDEVIRIGMNDIIVKPYNKEIFERTIIKNLSMKELIEL